MADLLIKIGLMLTYISSTFIIFDTLKMNKTKLKYYDYIIVFIPIIRSLYIIFKIEVNE